MGMGEWDCTIEGIKGNGEWVRKEEQESVVENMSVRLDDIWRWTSFRTGNIKRNI